MYADREESMSPTRVFLISLVVLILGLGGALSFKMAEDVSADEYTVIQSPVKGELTWYLTQGLKYQGLGTVTAYKIRMTYDFTEKGYNVQFNEGGHGTIYGSIQCELPADINLLTPMHRKYGGQASVENGLIKTATDSALYLVGPLMSSRESYAEKKNDLIHYVTDQVQFGPYRTRQERQSIKDPVTGQDKETVSAAIVMNRDGKPERQEASALSQYGIRCYQFTIKRLAYDEVVAKQITQQQQITMDVQTSMAEKVKAEQRALTVEQQGRADATAAKWKQETIKAQAVTQAEQEREVELIKSDRERKAQIINAERDKAVAETSGAQRLAVAKLDREAADLTKQKDILLGEGESERKRLVLAADGALEQKLEAYKFVTPKIFEALRGTALVPTTMLGGGGNQSSSAMPLIDLLTAKAAKDLSLDMSMSPQPTIKR